MMAKKYMPAMDMPPQIDSSKIGKDAKVEQVSQFRNSRTEVQTDENGKEYVMIEGKKLSLDPRPDNKKTANKAADKTTQVAGVDGDK